VAGGDRLAVWPSHETLSTTHTGPGQTGDSVGNRASPHRGFASSGLFWQGEHSHNFAGASDDATRRGRSRTAYLGHIIAGSALTGSSTVVAGVLSLCASSCLAANATGSAARERTQADGTTLPAENSSDGRWENHATMDSARVALLALTACSLLSTGGRATEARSHATSWP
jgi:hypothetical protein